jgi:hypothetical protein
MIRDVLLHMVLEAIGGGILLYALGFCNHWRHRLLVWFVLALIFSYITVRLIG